ncbi:MAG TPA: competence type IV pilus major pilin ComGC [Pseudogracilibacillus sp.]|nr:competence type IV pilus major pilin ComGC [Pseudogracilibacillus sp.]
MFKNEKGFTLIEMLVVLLIITVLILLIVPNLGGKTGTMHDEGCDALIVTVQGQADMYELDNGSKIGSIDALANADYINDNQKTCKNGSSLTISNGKVSAN